MYHLFIWACGVINALAGFAGKAMWHGRYLFDIMIAISFFPGIVSAYFYDKTNPTHKRSLRIIATLCLSNIYDEVFGNPYKLGWNEVAFAAEIIMYEFGVFRYIYRKITTLWTKYTS